MAVNLVARNPRANTRRDPVAPARRMPPMAVRPPVDPWAEFNPQRGQTGFADNVTVADLMNTRVNPSWRPQVPVQNAPGSFWDTVVAESDRKQADALLQPTAPPPRAGGGVGGGGAVGGGARADTLARATAALEEQLAGLGGIYGDRLSGIESMYGSQLGELAGTFGGYRDSLTQLANASRGQINDATAQALARLAELDPQAAFQWAVGEAGTPGVAGSEYLSAIGANPAEVDAVRMLSDQLMRQQLSAAQQYSMGAQSSMDRERQARQAASGLMSQEALNALAQTEQMRGTQISDEETRRRQAMESAMRQEMAAVEAERVQREQALRDQLLRYQLEYDLGV